MSAITRAFPAARRQTYVFLEDARRVSHVYLLTEVDASAIRAARAASGGKLSFVTFVVKAAADVISEYPDARAVLHGRRRPRLTVPDGVHAKVLFDKTIGGQRCVLSGIVPDTPALPVLDVQNEIDRYKSGDTGPDGPWGRAAALQRLPVPVIRVLWRLAMRRPVRRARLQGTFAVTSIGGQPVRAILPLVSGALGLGVGQVSDVPAVRDGELAVIPALTLSLAFDHRILDGAMATEILARIKTRLETWESS